MAVFGTSVRLSLSSAEHTNQRQEKSHSGRLVEHQSTQSQRFTEGDVGLNVCFVQRVNCDFNPLRCVPPQKKRKKDPLNVRWVIKQTEPRFTLIPHSHFLSLIWQIYTLLLPEYAALHIIHLAGNPFTESFLSPSLWLLVALYLRKQLSRLRGKQWSETRSNVYLTSRVSCWSSVLNKVSDLVVIKYKPP